MDRYCGKEKHLLGAVVSIKFLDDLSIEPLFARLGTLRQEMRELLTKNIEALPHDETRKSLEIRAFTEILEVVVKRWTIPILWELEVHRGLHFNELQRNVTGISSRTLSDRLKELEGQSIVRRSMEDTHPPKVFYELSDKGQGIVELSLLLILHLLKSKKRPLALK
jgi:DNA-binding HxlR family transcriptional regulator